MRRLPALLTAAALATVLASSLSACGAIAVPGFGGCVSPYEPGEASDLVEATGGVGREPDISFPTPLIVDGDPQLSSIIAGEGDPIPVGGTVDFAVTLLDGESGRSYDSAGYDGQPARLGAGTTAAALNQSLTCSKVGERYALTTRAEDAYAEDALPEGLAADTTLVFVVDVIASYLGKADGMNQWPEDGMPNVVTAPDGHPGITVPSQDAPDETRVAVTKAGGGAVVEDGDTVVVHFSSWTWPTDAGEAPRDVLSTWDTVPPVPLDQTLPAGEGSPLPPGVAAELEGLKVGSQVLVVISAAEAFPDGLPSNIDPASTLIYVVDVLGVTK